MTDSETRKAAYRWVAGAIEFTLNYDNQMVRNEAVWPGITVEVTRTRIRDAMAQAGAFPVAVKEEAP